MDNTKKCELCDETFTRNKFYNDNQWNKARFCSNSCSGKYRQKILWNKNEYRIKMSKSHIGFKMSDEQKNKIRIASSRQRPLYRGVKSTNWKGGVTKKEGYKRMMCRKRRNIKLNALGSHTFIEWSNIKEKYNFMCLCCKRCEPEIKLTEDHIIPLTKGGSDYIENIQPLCQSCNSRKLTRIIDYRNVWMDEDFKKQLMPAMGFAHYPEQEQ